MCDKNATTIIEFLSLFCLNDRLHGVGVGRMGVHAQLVKRMSKSTHTFQGVVTQQSTCFQKVSIPI